MKNFLLGVLAAAIIFVSLGTVHAQSPQASNNLGMAPVSTCLAVATLTTPNLCVGTDDIVVAWPGDKTYTSLKALKTGPTMTLTLNGTTKQLPATFQLINGAATVTAQ